MVDFSTYKKADLLDIAHKAGVTTVSKDTKKTLIDKLETYVAANGGDSLELIEESTDKVDVEVDSDDTEAEAEAEAEAETETDDESEFKGPPIDIKAWVHNLYSECIDPHLTPLWDWTDDVYYHITDYNDRVREQVSSVVALNYLGLVLEGSIFLYTYVPLASIAGNKSIHPVIKDLLPDFVVNSDIKVPDLSYLVDFKVASVLVNWVIYSVVIPLIVSFYINFTRKTYTINIGDEFDDELNDSELDSDKDDIDDIDGNTIYYTVRSFDFDPFVFALLKVVVWYVVSHLTNLAVFNSVGGFLKAVSTQVLIQFGIYREFTTVLGNVPLVFGVVTLVLGLYSQFEDY